MRTSPNRILTTHVGSQPCKQIVVDVLFDQDRDEPTPSFNEVIDATVLESCNPRHAHEWQVLRDRRSDAPEDKIIVPGVLDTTTNFVKHPELVAERLKRFAAIVGRDRVMAGSDCGFGSFASFGAVHPSITFEKLKSMTDGARMASERLWS